MRKRRVYTSERINWETQENYVIGWLLWDSVWSKINTNTLSILACKKKKNTGFIFPTHIFVMLFIRKEMNNMTYIRHVIY